ncbi:hypothetical protein LQW54_000019 [Pestalotiopsis sp. IQ-011]
MTNTDAHATFAAVEPFLERAEGESRPIVLMTCGSGKTTLAKAVLARYPHFQRLSIDEIIFENHGLYGLDYPADKIIHQQYEDEADAIYGETFRNMLENRRDIILERSFYAKEDREEFRALIQKSGAKCVLVYLRATNKEALWQRVCKRNAGERDANCALDIDRRLFESYWDGFEEPLEEGATITTIT